MKKERAAYKDSPPASVFGKIAIEEIGVKKLIESGWNLSEAEAEFGSDWLAK